MESGIASALALQTGCIWWDKGSSISETEYPCGTAYSGPTGRADIDNGPALNLGGQVEGAIYYPGVHMTRQ